MGAEKERKKREYINELNNDLNYSVSKFDTQTLTISGGALAFSLTFIKEIVSFNQAICLPLLYISLGCFIFTIFLGFYGHYMSMNKITSTIIFVYKDQFDKIVNDNDKIKTLNKSLIFSIIIGIIMLITYCIINIENQRNSQQNNTEITVQKNSLKDNYTNKKKHIINPIK